MELALAYGSGALLGAALTGLACAALLVRSGGSGRFEISLPVSSSGLHWPSWYLGWATAIMVGMALASVYTVTP